MEALFEQSVPGSWRAAIPVRLEIIEGRTSWAHPDGTIQVSSAHVNGPEHILRAALAHEGDCVARAFTGVDAPTHGLPSCAGVSFTWTVDWVGAGPGAHPRTR